MKWHNVENILPSQGEDVLMYDEWTITVGWYDRHVFETQSPDRVMHCITHWMPLPEPPFDECDL